MDEDKRLNNLSLLIKPTHKCNLNCKYCYEAENRQKMGNKEMRFEMIDHILKIATDYAKEIRWIWHGGEPTLMGIGWYKEVQEIFYKYMDKSRINQSMQSNGVLFNKEWGEFFRDYNISIGFSYDGCYQDSSRGIEQSKIEESVLELEKYKSSGGICVITNKNCNDMIEIYERYRDVLKCGVSFNYVFETPTSTKNNMLGSIEEFVNGYRKFFSYYMLLNHDKQIIERSVFNMISDVFGLRPNICTYCDCKEGWLGINADGRMFTCDRILKDDYCYGNVMEYDSIDDIFSSKGCLLFKNDCNIRLKTYCQDCGFLDYCGGLCNSNHAGTTGSASTPNADECNLFKDSFINTYDLLRDLDIYNSPVNKIVDFIIDNCFFPINEIKDFLEEKGFSRFMGYDKLNLLKCNEFKIFRIFNKINNQFGSNHFDSFSLSDNSKCNKDMLVVKNSRINLMNSIFSSNFMEIINILGGELNG